MEEKQLLESVTGMLDANGDRDVIVISRGVNRELHRDLTKAIREEKRYDKCTLYLTTNGGDPDGAFRIARCLRHLPRRRDPVSHWHHRSRHPTLR